jgi:hypothetical protein
MRKMPNGRPKATWKMIVPMTLPKSFRPVALSMALYRLATGIRAICNGSTSIATISRNTTVRPRHRPNTSE